MNKKILLFFVFIMIISLPVFAASINDLMIQADAAYALRENVAKAKESAKVYAQILEMDAQNYAAAWKLARAYYWIGDHSGDDKLEVYEQGEAFARKAIEIRPNGAEGHFWLGVNLGRIGETRGVLNSLFLVDPIKKEMEAILSVNPNDDSALYVLSVLYRKAPGWPVSIGDSDKSLDFALKAVKYAPQRHLNRIGLAEIYRAKGEKDKAIEQLNIAIALPLEKDRAPEGREDIKTARSLLNELTQQ